MSGGHATELSQRAIIGLVLKWCAGLVGLFAGLLAIARVFRAPLEALGRSFVERFGYFGMAFGTFIADGFHFPIPPQFYMLMAVSSGASRPLAFAVITAASLVGGVTGYHVARRLAHVRPIARRLERAQGLVGHAFSRFGYRAAILASLLPIAYSVLCYLGGLYRLPRRVFAVVCLCRIPRLLLFFYLVELGWAQ